MPEHHREHRHARAGANRYSQLYRNAPVACLAFTPKGVIREANRAACAFLRTDASTLLGQTLFRFVTDAHGSALRAHFQRATESSDSQSTDVSLRIPGMPHPLLVQIVSSRAGHDPLEVVSVIVDITERRRAEMVLAFLDNAEQALGTVHTTAAVVDQIPALAIPLLGDLCVVEFRDVANVIHQAAGHIDPRAAAQLRRLGCSFFDLPAIATAVAGVMAGKGPTIIERSDLARTFDLPAGDERLRCIRDVESLVILPLEGRGSIFGTLAIGSLGERFLAREDMHLAVELARRASLAIDNGRLFSELYDANAAKDRFLAMLSHELRTPLTPVLAAVSAFVARGSTAGCDVLGLFRMIQRNVQLEARLIDDLLDLTRVSRGKFELTFDDVDLRDLVLSVVSICESDAKNKGVILSVDTGERRSRVRGDPARLEQILWNLIKNAIKFTPKGGRVTVWTLDTGDEVHVAVEDTGIGVEPERMSRIFLPFVQADPSIARSFGGMGLGLSISKALAEAHEGSITVASGGAGRGATFTLALRALRSHESAPPSQPDACRVARFAPPPRMPSIAVSTAHPVRVLLVEDDPDTLAVTSMLLRGTYEVATAETVSQALSQLREHDFDLLISDISLHYGSGLDLMREMRERQKGVRGIALSGFGSQEDVRRARLAGFSVHLTKPVSFPRLETTIREITG